MTNEEAIKQLDGADIAVLNRDFFKFNQAIIMAISALRQQEHFREFTKKVEPLTNAQKIRAMSDEELVNFLMRLMGHAQCFAEGIFPYHPCPQNHNCKQCGIDWLQQPAEEDDHA